MIILSQRDPRWGSKQLGTSNTTIASHGCTITCLAMLANVTPDYVNERMKAVGGYAQGNLVIWSKVPQALPQLEFRERGWSYDNDKVKNNLPCLVEVNAAKIGGFRHWVVFVGNQKMYDPWDGKEKPTSTYLPLTGYAIYKVKPPVLSLEEKMRRIKEVLNSSISDSDKVKKIRELVF